MRGSITAKIAIDSAASGEHAEHPRVAPAPVGRLVEGEQDEHEAE